MAKNPEFLSQEFLFSFYDAKKKLISEFNGTEIKEPSLKETDVIPIKEETKENSEEKQETVDDKKHNGYKGKRKKFFNKNRFKDNKKAKNKETETAKELS